MSVTADDHTTLRSTTDRVRAAVRSTPWFTVLALAVLLDAADAFLMVSMRTTTGFIGQTQDPVAAWAFTAALLLPVVVLAVWGALLLARGRGPRTHRVLAGVGVTGLLTTLVAVTTAGLTAISDHQLQVREMAAMPSTLMMSDMPSALADGMRLQLVALGQLAVVVLLMNLALVGWFAAVQGGRLDRHDPRR